MILARPISFRLGIPGLYAIAVLAAFFTTRLCLTLWVGRAAVPVSTWPGIFFYGLWFDVAVLSALLVPVLVYEALLPDRWRFSRLHRALRRAWVVVSLFVLLFLAAAEAVFWLEFSTRFNFIAVDYLLYTHEVIGNIRESYPVTAIICAIAAAAALLTFVLRKRITEADSFTPSSVRRGTYLAAGVVLPAVLFSVTGVDQMGRIGNAYADELAGNGVFTFAAAARSNELDYDRFYATIPQETSDAILARLGVDRQPLQDPAFTVAAHEAVEAHAPGTPRRPRHVILIMVESLSAEFLGSYGSTQGLTPNLDRLAREGLRFANVYATGTRTVRGLEAVSLGVPPVPGQAIVRRPGNAHLSTLGELLEHQGFATSFVYGGYGYFDNMNAYFDANDYRVIDRTDFPRSSVVFENIWGVADEVLYDNVLKVMDANSGDRRAFLHVMTTSNHRPFSYPDGRIDIRSPGGREGAVKYTDWAIGKFIEDARRKPWFDDTLFVIVADHCAAVAGKSKLPVAGYRIPLILYAPKLVDAGVVERMVSQIDIPPTLLDVLQVDGDDAFFGRSVFELPSFPERAFVSNYQSLGYLKAGVLTVLSPGRKVEAFRVDAASFGASPMEIDRTLADEAIAYYQTAARGFKQGALLAPPYRQHEAALPAAR